jgi:hypothetical protein
MNLIENIQRINILISEDKKEDTIRTIVDKMGLANAIKMVGNYYMIEPYLKVVDKVNFIKEKVAGLSELLDNGITLVEPIHYDEDDEELRQIEYLRPNWVVVEVYDTDMNIHIGNFRVKYESLSVEIIEELVEILLNH